MAPIEADGKDCLVQFTREEGGKWESENHCSSRQTAEQVDERLVTGGRASARVLQVLTYTYRSPASGAVETVR
jgi:hypothetical protein